MALDHERIVGASLVGGKSITIHAIMNLESGEGFTRLRLYCRPSLPAPGIDFPKTEKVNVTCEHCKAKLKRELTVA